MKATLINRRLTLASVAVASIALVSGCSTRHTSQASYYSSYSYPSQSSGGSASTQEYTAQPAPSSEISTTSGDNTVIPLYKESVNIGKREVDAGSVTVKKIVKTETINQPVELRHEEIVVERQPGTGSVMDTTSAFQDGETTIHLTREEPVISKETTSAGQVVLHKSSGSEQTTVKATARSEDVAVSKSGNNVTIQGDMGAAESSGGQTSGMSSSGTITNPSMLNSSEDPSSLNGRSVQFSNLRVQNVVGDNVALLSTSSGQTLYAFCSRGAGSLKPGDNVNVTGTVRSSGSSSLSGDAAKVLSSQPMYIDAQKIETAQ